jgi:spermidine synthase
MADASPPAEPTVRLPAAWLFLNVFVVATCGLVYELLAGTLGSYLLGDSVTQFSLVIGLYLSAMGVGAWLSRWVDTKLARKFIEVELAVALLGGASAPALFLAFPIVSHFQIVLLAFVTAIGILVGLELPLLMRLLSGQLAFKDLVSRVLSVDYVGALAAALLFPLIFVPRLGLVRTSLVMGLCNCLVGLWGTWLLEPLLASRILALRVRAIGLALLLVVGVVKADWLTARAEDEMFADPILAAQTTSYQRIVVTANRAGFNLFLNGNLQFSAADEYRYHEALVAPAIAAAGKSARNVLILGGGDGLALREVLATPGIESVTLVELDPAMVRLARGFQPLVALNRGAFFDPRVTVVHDDAMIWLAEAASQSDSGRPARRQWDVAIVDFPDPNTYALGKLYTKLFYRRLRAQLAPGGAVAVQTTSPLFARRSFWCVVETMRAAGLTVHPYQVAVPSFGVWGFALARAEPFDPPRQIPGRHRFLNDDTLAAMFQFSADMGPVAAEVNQLDNQVLVRYYEHEWRRWQ